MKQQGFTLLEIMVAIVVFAVGATGLIAMQSASVLANQDAAETTTAINIGNNWLERIKRDARRWNAVGNTDLSGTNTTYLNNVASNAGKWIVPADNAPEYPTADFFGFDTSGDFDSVPSATVANAMYCVNLQFTVAHAYNGSAGGTKNAASDADAVRADVRVWWYRNMSGQNRSGKCRTAALTAAQLASNNIRKIYLSTVVRWKELGWP